MSGEAIVLADLELDGVFREARPPAALNAMNREVVDILLALTERMGRTGDSGCGAGGRVFCIGHYLREHDASCSASRLTRELTARLNIRWGPPAPYRRSLRYTDSRSASASCSPWPATFRVAAEGSDVYEAAEALTCRSTCIQIARSLEGRSKSVFEVLQFDECGVVDRSVDVLS